ncbi:MAG: hypothetical protein CSA31_02930 [Desulfobulbus propionicus]|nr:MAG: hypothetical protein CSB34_06210 [Desulfobulbus propionicus]PIE60265.1 MAG: hypothetical protein CSA31_02930 [Desulfobulbus propionicus]
MNLQRTLTYYHLRLKRLQGSPRSLALGVAIGAAIGITPTIPFHTVLILATTLLFRANPISAFITGIFVSNPFTFIPQYYAAWVLGDLLFPDRLTWIQMKELFLHLKAEGWVESLYTIYEVGINATLVMMTGGLLLAIPCGLLFYFIGLRFFTVIQQKSRDKHFLNHKE